MLRTIDSKTRPIVGVWLRQQETLPHGRGSLSAGMVNQGGIDRHGTRLIHAIALALTLIVATTTTGCVTESPNRSRVLDHIAPSPTPPPEIEQLLRPLIAYRAAEQHYPQQLMQLVEAGLIPAGKLTVASDVAYSAAGLGVLHNGKRVLLVDSEIRVPNHAWCILETRSRTGSVLTLELIGMGQLQRAANAASTSGA